LGAGKKKRKGFVPDGILHCKKRKPPPPEGETRNSEENRGEKKAKGKRKSKMKCHRPEKKKIPFGTKEKKAASGQKREKIERKRGVVTNKEGI